VSFFYEDRPSASPFVDSIWRSRGETVGCHLAIADGSWDFIIIHADDHPRVCVAGASTQASRDCVIDVHAVLSYVTLYG